MNKRWKRSERRSPFGNKCWSPIIPILRLPTTNLASIYQDLGAYEQALAAQQKALSAQEQVLESSHPSVATSYNNLASIYQDLGAYEQALAAQQKALDIRKQILEPNHPDLAQCYHNLAGLYRGLGNYERALQSQKNAIAIFEQVLEPDHPNLGLSYRGLGTIFYSKNQLDSALMYEQRARIIFQARLSDNHPYLKTGRDNLAFLYPKRAAQRRADGDYEGAIEDLQSAFAFSDDQGELYIQIGLNHYYAKQYVQAIENYNSAFQLGGIEQWIYLNNTGMAYAKSSDFEEAHIRIEQLQSLMPEHYVSYRAWSLYYALTGDLEIALDNLEQAITLGYTDENWLLTEEALAPLRELPRFQELLDRIPDE